MGSRSCRLEQTERSHTQTHSLDQLLRRPPVCARIRELVATDAGATVDCGVGVEAERNGLMVQVVEEPFRVDERLGLSVESAILVDDLDRYGTRHTRLGDRGTENGDPSGVRNDPQS